MPRLIGTEGWSEEDISQTRDFLLNCVREASNLSDALGSPPTGLDERSGASPILSARRERTELLTELIELLLVTDRVDEAKGYLRDPGWILFGHGMAEAKFEPVSTDIGEFVRLSLFATLGKNGRMGTNRAGLFFALDEGAFQLPWTWDQEVHQALPTLLMTALSTGTDQEVIDVLIGQIREVVNIPTDNDILSNPTFDLLGLFGPGFEASQKSPRIFFDFANSPDVQGGLATLLSLERRYARRVEQMRRDSYHWRLLRPGGDLIDWGLLLAQVAMARSGYPPILDETVSNEAQFLRSLATELA
jgi:hypothetical protein